MRKIYQVLGDIWNGIMVVVDEWPWLFVLLCSVVAFLILWG